MRHRSLITVLAVLSLACRTDRDGPDVAFGDSAGVAIVENRLPAWQGRGWEVGPEPLLDLGSADAAAAYRFENVIDAGRLPDGTLVVADAGRNQLLYYDAAGGHLATAGGPGGGPGEFGRLGAMQIIGDSVVAFDLRRGRVSIFDDDGVHVATVVLDPTSDDRHPIHTYNLVGVPGRSLVVSPWAYMPGAPGAGGVGAYWDSAANLVYGLDGALLDTVGFSRAEMEVSARGASGRPFGARTFVAASGGRLYSGDGKRYEIRVRDRDGRLERIIRRPTDPRPVTAGDRDRLIAHHVRNAGFDSPDDPRAAGLRAMLDAASLPETMPAFQRMLVDEPGNLWVAAYRPPWDRGVREWSVFDPTGRWLGDVVLPERFRLLHVGRESVIGVWRDSLDVQHLRVLALERTR